MLLIRTEIRPSKIHGLGCFSIEKVKKGQIIWVFDPRIDTRFEVSEMYNLHDVAKEFVMIYGYQEIINGKGLSHFVETMLNMLIILRHQMELPPLKTMN